MCQNRDYVIEYSAGYFRSITKPTVNWCHHTDGCFNRNLVARYSHLSGCFLAFCPKILGGGGELRIVLLSFAGSVVGIL